MRFGKVLALAEDPAFAGTYLPYKQLKKLLRSSVTSGGGLPSGAGHRTPDGDVCRRLFSDCLVESLGRVNSVVTEGLAQHADDEELHRFLWYAELNIAAAQKIIKKWEKRFGLSAECREAKEALTAQPFVELVHALELPDAVQHAAALLPGALGRIHGGGAARAAAAAASGASNEGAALAHAGGSPVHPRAPDAPAVPAVRRTASATTAFAPEISLAVMMVLTMGCAILLDDLLVKALMSIAGVGLLVAIFFLLPLRAMAAIDSTEAGQAAVRPARRTCVWACATFGELVARLDGPTACADLPKLMLEDVHIGGRREESCDRCAASVPAPEGTAFLHPPRVQQRSCPCCLGDFCPKDRVAVLRCGHLFCEECVRRWAAEDAVGGSACPVCRMAFIQESV